MKSGVPSPVHLDFTAEAHGRTVENAGELSLASYGKSYYRTDSAPHPDPKSIASAISLLSKAKRPMIVASTGCFYDKAWDALKAVAEKADIAVVESGPSRGHFSDAHPLSASAAPDALLSVDLVMLGLIIGLLNGFGGTAIILKSQALSVKVKPFVEAARVAGGNNWHIIFRHIIPNVLPLSFLYMMFTVTEAIALEATLSFFGLLNVDMSWGLMIQIAQVEGYLLRFDTWWLIVPPGLAVTLLAAAFFLVGRAMDEVVNPRLRAR